MAKAQPITAPQSCATSRAFRTPSASRNARTSATKVSSSIARKAAGRDLGLAIAAQVGDDDAESGGDERRNLVAPERVRVGKAVQEQHVRPGTDDLDVHIEAVDPEDASGGCRDGAVPFRV